MNLLQCSNCELYDDGGCLEMEMGMVPEQCQIFTPIECLGIYSKLIALRGMKILTTIQVMERPTDVSPLTNEELKGLHVNILI